MKKMILLVMIINVSNILFSQQIEQSSLYMFNALNYNPAYAGSRNSISGSLITRKQWVGFDGAPTTTMVSFHSPAFNRKIGLGLHLTNDKIGARSKTSLNIDITSSLVVNKKGDRVNIGLTAGYENNNLNFSNLYALDPNDLITNTNYSLNLFPVGFGVYYYGKKHYISLSVPNVIQNNINTRHFILAAGKVFKLNSVIELKPSIMLKAVPGSPIVMDANISFLIYKKIWLGGLYRLREGAGVNAAFIINDICTIGYAYDFPLVNHLIKNQYGSHELVLQFDISNSKTKSLIYSPRYF